MDARARTPFRFDEIEFDPAELRLLRRGAVVELQPKVSRLLEILLSRSGQLVPKDVLIDELWPESVVNDEALTQLVRKLRKALGDDAQSPRFIQTVTTRGYRFVASVTEASGHPGASAVAPTAEMAAPPPTPPPAVPVSTVPVPSWLVEARARANVPRARGRRTLAVVAAVSVAVAAAGVWWWLARPTVHPLRAGCCEARRVTFSTVHKQDLTFFPDGRTLACAVYDPREGQLDLVLVSVEGGAEVRLTQTSGDEYGPGVAPAGDLVLFGRTEPDGSSTAVVIPPLGGAERVVAANAAWPTFAPSGGAIAFARRRPGGWVLVVRHLDDESEREVGRSSLPPRSLAFSPDGARLAYTDGRRLLAIDLATGTECQVGETAAQIGGLTWERPTAALLFGARWVGGSSIWRIGVGGGPAEAVTATSGDVIGPAVSPDARRVAFVQERSDHVYLDLDGTGRLRRTLPVDPTLHEIDIDPSGLRIVGRRGAFQPGGGRIVAGPIEGGATLALGGGDAGLPVFAPDGTTIAFVEREAGGQGLRVARVPGESTWVLPAEPDCVLGRPVFSPDGGQLAVAVSGRKDAIVVVPTAGGAPRDLAAGRFTSLAWSPDGRLLAAPGFVDGASGTHVIDAASGTVRRLIPQRSVSAAPVFSADSRSLWVLVSERARPRLLRLGLDGRELAPPLDLVLPVEPTIWGVFEVRPRSDGWLAVLERRDADIWLLESGER